MSCASFTYIVLWGYVSRQLLCCEKPESTDGSVDDDEARDAPDMDRMVLGGIRVAAGGRPSTCPPPPLGSGANSA